MALSGAGWAGRVSAESVSGGHSAEGRREGADYQWESGVESERDDDGEDDGRVEVGRGWERGCVGGGEGACGRGEGG